MDLTRALDSAIQILTEEQTRPTLHYAPNMERGTSPGMKIMTNIMAVLPLSELRKRRPREVFEFSDMYAVGGENYKLLTAVISQLNKEEQPKFIADLLTHVERGGGRAGRALKHNFPTLEGRASYLPLIGELCLRLGYVKDLFAALAKVKVPTVATALLLMQLEETIALNFDVFTDSELQKIPEWLAQLRTMAELQTWSSKHQGGKVETNPHYRQGWQTEAEEIVKSVDGITAECRQARYFYLKGALHQPTVNLEVESDKAEVEDYLKKLGFRDDMIKALDAAERDYRADATGFELKNVMGQLRSVLEFIYRDAATAIAAQEGDAAPANWNNSLMYLLKKKFITEPQDKLVRGLYAVLSDEGAHPILAKAEFARLARNMVIEMSLMFLTVLDGKKIKIT
jgi:hypothetical protein